MTDIVGAEWTDQKTAIKWRKNVFLLFLFGFFFGCWCCRCCSLGVWPTDSATYFSFQQRQRNPFVRHFFFGRLYGTRFRPDPKVSVKLFPILFLFPSLHYKVYTKATTRLLVVVVDGTSVHSEHTAHDSWLAQLLFPSRSGTWPVCAQRSSLKPFHQKDFLFTFFSLFVLFFFFLFLTA